MKHAETPARPPSSTPGHTLLQRPPIRDRAAGTRTHRRTSCASLATQPAPAPRVGSAWKWAGSIMARTYARHRAGETRLDFPHRFHSTKCGRPPAPGRPLGTVASKAIWARVGTHLSTPAGGATSLSAAVPPASGRRPSAFPKPQRPQVCCSHLRRRHRRASLLRNQQSKWWKLVDGTGLSYRQPGQDGRH